MRVSTFLCLGNYSFKKTTACEILEITAVKCQAGTNKISRLYSVIQMFMLP